MRIATVSIPFDRALRTWLLAALVGIGCGFPSALHGGERIHAYRDSSGRVVFANDTSSELSSPPQTASTVQTTSQEAITPAPVHKQAVSPKQTEGVQAPAASGNALQSSWEDAIQQTASRHQVDPDLVRAMVRVESNFNPNAVSTRGASGLMQLIPATAQRFGVRNIFDPKANLDGGVRYLKYLMNLFGGDLKLSLAAYNAGENAVGRHNGVPPFPETQDYLRKISELYPLPRLLSAKSSSTGIEKFVDSNGIVHFSNTDLP